MGGDPGAAGGERRRCRPGRGGAAPQPQTPSPATSGLISQSLGVGVGHARAGGGGGAEALPRRASVATETVGGLYGAGHGPTEAAR